MVWVVMYMLYDFSFKSIFAIFSAADHFLSFRVNASYQKNISVPVSSFFRFYSTVQHIDTDTYEYLYDRRPYFLMFEYVMWIVKSPHICKSTM